MLNYQDICNLIGVLFNVYINSARVFLKDNYK